MSARDEAWLASRETEYPLTHNLGILLTMLAELGCDIHEFEELLELTAFAVQFRYEAFETAEEPLHRPQVLADTRALYNHVRHVLRA